MLVLILGLSNFVAVMVQRHYVARKDDTCIFRVSVVPLICYVERMRSIINLEEKEKKVQW